MRRIYVILFFYCLVVSCIAQTQQGVVKTKGRMVNGKHVAGQGLSGATVTIQGRSAVLSQSNGTFSFPVTNKAFTLQGVKKNGYQLVDADATGKAYQYSLNTFYIVMETPEQQQADKVAAERKLRRTLQQQLQKRENEIDAMKVSLEEKSRLLAELYKQQENNEKLIADMAQEYSQMDYDQMDEMNRQISDAILNGELTRVDSLLRSKGDISSRIASVRKAQEAETRREKEIARQQEVLDASKEGTQKRLEDIAQDCKNYFDRFKMSNQYDSAAYYIELRAELDTMNVVWQSDAGFYYYEQNQHKKSEIYLVRALSIYRRFVQDNPQAYEPGLAHTLHNIGLLYSNTKRLEESERMYKESADIRRRLAHGNPQAYEPDLAQTLHNIGLLCSNKKRYEESETMLNEALEIRRRLVQRNPQVYENSLAWTLTELGDLYSKMQRLNESETMYKEALEIRRRLAQQNPQAYEPNLASMLNSLALQYQNSKRFEESEEIYKESLEIHRRLAQQNPQTYEPSIAWILNNLAILYNSTNRLEECKATYQEALEVYSRLAKNNPQTYQKKVDSIKSFLESHK